MEDLRMYISIIEPQLLNQTTGKVRQLIDAVREHKFISEEVLKQNFIGAKKNPNYFYNLKSRTLEILQAFAIISSSKADGEVKKKLDLCRKKKLLGQKLLGKGVSKEGIRLIKQAQKIAIEYEFVHIASELSSLLYRHYASSSRNWETATHYAIQVEKYAQHYLDEKRIEHYFYQMIGCLNGAMKAIKFKDIALAIRQLKGETLRGKTYQAMSQVLFGLSTGSYQLMIDSSEEALDFFKGRKGVYTSHYHFFLTNMAVAQIVSGNYSRAQKSLSMAQEHAYPRSKNVYIIKLYQTICALHAGQYSKAYQIYNANKKCKFEDIRQQFAIIEAYMCFSSYMGYLHLEGKFRIGKYLNETFKAQSDKQGSNISILIAELLVYLVRNRGKFIDRVEAINNYSYRHLKGEETKRAKRFIKILCLMPRANFNAIALKRLASRQIKYIEENPIHMGGNLAIEIIPFEDLLGMIMQQLERKVA